MRATAPALLGALTLAAADGRVERRTDVAVPRLPLPPAGAARASSASSRGSPRAAG